MNTLNINAAPKQTNTTVLGLEVNNMAREQLLEVAKSISMTTNALVKGNTNINSERTSQVITGLEAELKQVVSLYDNDDIEFNKHSVGTFQPLEIGKPVITETHYIYGVEKSQVTTSLLLNTAKDVQKEIAELEKLSMLESTTIKAKIEKYKKWSVELVKLYDTMHKELEENKTK